MIAALLHLTSPWTARHPNAVEPQYVVDPAAQKAWRMSDIPVDDWSRGVLKAEGGQIGVLPGDAFGGDVAAPAAPVPAEPAPVSMATGTDGRVTITAGFHPGAAVLILAYRAPGGIEDVRVNGQPARVEGTKAVLNGATPPPPFTLKPNQWGKVIWAAPEGYSLSFKTADPSKVEVETAEVYDRWMSVKPLPPMPVKDQAWDMSGASLVLGKATVGK